MNGERLESQFGIYELKIRDKDEKFMENANRLRSIFKCQIEELHKSSEDRKVDLLIA